MIDIDKLLLPLKDRHKNNDQLKKCVIVVEAALILH